MNNIKLAFIGCGHMGRCLIGGLISNHFPVKNITGVDPDASQRDITSSQFGIRVCDNSMQAVPGADVVVIAVKPPAVEEALVELRETLAANNPLLLSIAAGIPFSALSRWAGNRLAIVRVMPNTPALVNAGASGLCANRNVSDNQRNIAEKIMRSVGITTWVEDEKLMDVITALSGSGPAYFFYFMEIMKNTGEQLGLTAEQATMLTLETALGAAKIAMESEYDPETLRKHVTSPGGTTERAMEVMLENDIAAHFRAAIVAACDRSREIADSAGDTE